MSSQVDRDVGEVWEAQSMRAYFPVDSGCPSLPTLGGANPEAPRKCLAGLLHRPNLLSPSQMAS